MKKLILVLWVSSFTSMAAQKPLSTVSFVDIDRYLGTWYEIARFDHSFQRGCSKTSATYEKRSDGDIRVINKCLKEGKWDEAIGRAWIKDEKTNAKLKVQFFLTWAKLDFLAGNYWVLALDQNNYEYVLIGEPSRKYLWILSRTKKLDEDIYNTLIQKAKEQGFDTSKLLTTEQ